MTDKNYIAVGKFGAPHGLKGAVKLNSYTEDPQSIFDFDVLYDAKGNQEYHIHYIGAAKQQFLISVDGVSSKEEAAALTNKLLHAPEDSLPELDEDDFYITELVGCSIVTQDTGATYGTVKAVHNFGAGDIIEIQPDEGKSEMVLFTQENFPECDVRSRRLTFRPPELLDATHHEKD